MAAEIAVLIFRREEKALAGSDPNKRWPEESSMPTSPGAMNVRYLSGDGNYSLRRMGAYLGQM